MEELNNKLEKENEEIKEAMDLFLKVEKKYRRKIKSL